MSSIVFVYTRNSKPSGFAAETDSYWVEKTGSTATTQTSTIFQLEPLKKNLRRLVKEKKAHLIKLGTTEAVSVPQELLAQLFI